jgi:aminotransferase
MTDIGELGFRDDFEGAAFFLDVVGVAAVPGSSFYHRAELGHHMLRFTFTFSKSNRTLAAAAERLEHLGEKLAARQRR